MKDLFAHLLDEYYKKLTEAENTGSETNISADGLKKHKECCSAFRAFAQERLKKKPPVGTFLTTIGVGVVLSDGTRLTLIEQPTPQLAKCEVVNVFGGSQYGG